MSAHRRPNSSQLRFSIPIVGVEDLERSSAFYQDVLGFSQLKAVAGTYAVLIRDDVEIYLWSRTEPLSPQQSGCRIRVDNIEDLYREYQSAGVIHPSGILKHKPWGTLEFAISDPEGNLMTFFEPAQM
jgi:catechol 2,3-dioxygenase-like lactoylglutathione lyase family enzyme